MAPVLITVFVHTGCCRYRWGNSRTAICYGLLLSIAETCVLSIRFYKLISSNVSGRKHRDHNIHRSVLAFLSRGFFNANTARTKQISTAHTESSDNFARNTPSEYLFSSEKYELIRRGFWAEKNWFVNCIIVVRIPRLVRKQHSLVRCEKYHDFTNQRVTLHIPI